MLELTDMKQWWTARELLDANPRGLPDSKSALAILLGEIRGKVCPEGKPRSRRREGRGGGFEYHYYAFSELTRLDLIAYYQRQQAAVAQVDGDPAERAAPDAPQAVKDQWAMFTAASEKKKDKARRKLAVVKSFQVLRDQNVPFKIAQFDISRRFKLGVGTINNWRNDCIRVAERDWLAFLLPANKGRVKTSAFTPAAWDAFKADYLRLEEPTATACYERLKGMADAHGWIIPSIYAVKRKLAREVPEREQILARKGAKAAKGLFPAQERDRSDLHALEGVNADGHTLDVWVKWHDGEVIRPVATMIADIYSNKFLAWRIDKSESATAVRLAFHDLFRDWGIPDWALLDNGRAFASKQISGGQKTRFRFKVNPDENEGILTALGIRVHWATPYSGQSKPIERNFRSVCDYIAKAPQFAGAYAGNSPTNKPGYTHDPRSKAVPFDDFMAVFDAGIHAYNARDGRRSAVCDGKLSFDAAFAASYADVPIRKALPAQLSMAMLTATKVTARKPSGEVHLLGNRYWSPFLNQHIGQQLTLRFDPDNLTVPVLVYDAEGRFIGEAAALEVAGFHSVEAARTHGKARRDYLRTLREAERIQNSMSLDEYLKLMPEAGAPAPAPQTKTVRMVKVAGGRDLEVLPPAEAELDRPVKGVNFDALRRGITLYQNNDEI
ncbi:MAG: transposase domain-containing protein [Paracoccaceae bacterium]